MRILFVGKEREKGQKICNIYYIVTRRSGISDRFLRFQKKETKTFDSQNFITFFVPQNDPRRDTYYIPVKKDRFFREYRGGEARLVKGEGEDWSKSSKTERRFLARANYDPTWRVKGNPICITRRASYRHESTISPFTRVLLRLLRRPFFFPLLPPSRSSSTFTLFPPAAVDQVPLGFSTRRLFIETGEPGIGRAV